MTESLFAEANDRLKQKMVKETERIWTIAQQKSISMRTAAYVHALDRIGEAINAKGTRDYYISRSNLCGSLPIKIRASESTSPTSLLWLIRLFAQNLNDFELVRSHYWLARSRQFLDPYFLTEDKLCVSVRVLARLLARMKLR